MFNKALFNKEKEENYKNKELTEEDFDQINKEISKALSNMKKENQDNDSNENIDEAEAEKELNNFDYDFFSENSNSFSNDNISDISENSFKSANVEMKRNNSLKINMINNNFKINNNNNNFSGITKDGSNSSNELSNSLKGKNNSFCSMEKMENKRNNNNQNNNIKVKNINKPFHSSPYLINLSNYKMLENNNFFNDSGFNNINNLNNSFNNNPNMQMNNQYIFDNNINNNPNIQMNNISIINKNKNNNPNMQMNNLYMINNNINNNPNMQMNNQSMINNSINNINPNLQLNNQPILNNNLNFVNANNDCFNNINTGLKNLNIIHLNNTINNNQYLINNNNNNNNYFSYPSITERGVPGLYNLDSPENIINLDNILRSRDKRTTLIIRNIPNKYTISLLLNELNKNFEHKFDIVYLPQDYINNSNLGFGFINFINHMHLILFYDEFVGKKWNCFNSKKRCQLAYSKYQGKNELMKYIHTKLSISNLDNNNENIKKSFFINNNQNNRAPIEIPIKFYSNFVSFYPFSLCHNKDDKVFIVDKYYNI